MKKTCHRIKILFLLAVLAAGFWRADARAQTISGTTLMYALDKVNVRKGPGTDTEILGEIEQGETVFAVELTEEGWYRVVYDGETGYIRQDFLAVYGAEGEWEEPSPEDVDKLFDTDQLYDPDVPEKLPEPKIRKVNPEQEMSKEDGEASPSSAHTQKSGSKINASTVVIIVLAAGIILIYGAIQIVMEKRGGEGTPKGEDEAEEEEPEDYEGAEEDRLPEDDGLTEDAGAGEEEAAWKALKAGMQEESAGQELPDILDLDEEM